MPITLHGTPEQISRWKRDAAWWATYYAAQGRDYDAEYQKYLADIARGVEIAHNIMERAAS